jgi:surface antigen
MYKQTIKPLVITACLLSVGLAQAANMAFMMDQAMSRFNDEDAKLFNAASAKALAAKDGTPIRWSNPGSGAFGTLTPYPDPQKNPACREIHMENVAENVKSAGYYRFCKRSDGSWQPVMPSRK